MNRAAFLSDEVSHLRGLRDPDDSARLAKLHERRGACTTT